MEYPVLMRDVEVGKLLLEQKGLYYHYSCCIQVKEAGMYRIFALSGQNRINLGVCQPVDGKWITKGKIPCQQLKLTDIQLKVVSHRFNQTDVFLLGEENSFPYLEQLSHCRFTRIQNKPAVTLESFTNR